MSDFYLLWRKALKQKLSCDEVTRGQYLVSSFSNPGWHYSVSWTPTGWTCTCKATAGACKHRALALAAYDPLQESEWLRRWFDEHRAEVTRIASGEADEVAVRRARRLFKRLYPELCAASVGEELEEVAPF